MPIFCDFLANFIWHRKKKKCFQNLLNFRPGRGHIRGRSKNNFRKQFFFADFSFLDKNKTKQKNEKKKFSRRIYFLLTPSKFEIGKDNYENVTYAFGRISVPCLP